MDDGTATPGTPPVDDTDRVLLELLSVGRSAAQASEVMGLTLAGTALRLSVIRRRLGVTSTTAAINLVCGGDSPIPRE